MTAPSRPGAPRTPTRTAQRTPARPGTKPQPGRRPASSASSTASVPRIEAAPVRGAWAAALSWRSLVLLGVLGLAATLVLPSVRVYLDQRAQIAELTAERDAAQDEVDDLAAEVARWDDPAFVIAQARERLAYVFPGETPYKVVDPQVAQPVVGGSVEAQLTGADAAEEGAWFEGLWQAVEEVGNGPEVAVAEPAPLPVQGPAEPEISVDLGG